MEVGLDRFEKIDVWKSMGVGLLIDLIAMFGLWPAFGEPYPTFGQFLITIIFGQLAGLAIIFMSKVKGRR